ncbi:alpha/beta-hydrolase [Ramaria rubella]|nr:alpha/beta-hydrolase [Ramaria rubella]
MESTSPDFSHLPYDRPADKIKTLDVPPIREDVHIALLKYRDAARGYSVIDFERLPKENQENGQARVYLTHRPADEQVSQVFRVPNPGDTDSIELERITYFKIGTGRTIVNFRPIEGDDWHGIWRAGGAVLAMDLDGSEKYQLWRYWEDLEGQKVLPRLASELDNKPGKGRIERLTHDGFRYSQVTTSPSNRIMAYTSTKANGRDTLVYVSKLVDSSIGAHGNTENFTLSAKLVTPPAPEAKAGTWWTIKSISLDDNYILLSKFHGASHQPLYIANISEHSSSEPEQIVFPGIRSDAEVAIQLASFSRDPRQPNLIYLVTNAYGDFASVVMYNIKHRSISHITTFEPNLLATRPIPWDIQSLRVSAEHIIFKASVEGWSQLFILPLQGTHGGQVIQIKFDREIGDLSCISNSQNGKAWEIVLDIANSNTARSLFSIDLRTALEDTLTDEEGNPFVLASLKPYKQAQAIVPTYRTLSAQLFKYQSFDGLEIPVMYYHPSNRQKAVPLVISIHGGPAIQATSLTKMSIHGYVINELNCAIMYPNVRGSRGYGKRFMAADDVEKREDSVKDIGALLDYVAKTMTSEIIPERIAVVGSSYGGYMTYACLVHFSSQLKCGLATCPIGDWNAFLSNTAKFRQANRRREYGDETDPNIREFLERISPLNHAEKVAVPLLTSHGENDTRVPVEEAIKMWDMVKRNGIHSELIVAEKEGHGVFNTVFLKP